MTKFDNILFIGCGNMAGAMLDGWLAGGMPGSAFTIFDPAPRNYPDGVTALDAMPDSGDYDAILIGVKPHMLGDIAESLAPLAGQDTVILSILAGVELETLRKRFPQAKGVVRVMPNLAVALGKSPVGLAQDGMDEGGKDSLIRFFDPLGLPEWVGEDDFDLFTALAGSGPAFVYRVIDALAKGAEDLGFPPDKAVRTATAMVEGAAALASHSPDDPGTLADRVASPGGTTRAGLDVLDDDQAVFKLMQATLKAAQDRSAEMSREARG